MMTPVKALIAQRLAEQEQELESIAEVSGAGTASAGLPGYTADDKTE